MTADVSAGEARDVASNTYVYLYPLVTMKITRLQGRPLLPTPDV
jgi:hypothetical protein